ncbi:DUF4437 domain-containing protein [Alteromonas halophila]|uniref:DUF4437 domain-containing protein n=1 Tax=Alteromonas halophila TaxID=516698 RepID=A0A918JRV9_9ALTE|nr:DUF4437 domain-containing protein [Alteromonas halophila]GGW93276.1 hypothetical protein GCM10007391_29490 [Alteromonas halophila]
MKYYRILIIVLGALITMTAACAKEGASQSQVIQAENVNWGYLNPLRGDKSPAAADLWGDRTKDKATGMLVRFNDGFSSPPHIHNISYRGIVIQGEMHNDDPHASPMWLPAGSFWTQPAGASHITAANAPANMIYLEIDSGPYMVKPVEAEFDNGQHPINVHASNLVWLDAKASELIEGAGISIAHLWQKKDRTQGEMIRLAADTSVALNTDTDTLKLVVIAGRPEYRSAQEQDGIMLDPGSFVSSQGKVEHTFTTDSKTILYVRSQGNIRVKAK